MSGLRCACRQGLVVRTAALGNICLDRNERHYSPHINQCAALVPYEVSLASLSCMIL